MWLSPEPGWGVHGNLRRHGKTSAASSPTEMGLELFLSPHACCTVSCSFSQGTSPQLSSRSVSGTLISSEHPGFHSIACPPPAHSSPPSPTGLTILCHLLLSFPPGLSQLWGPWAAPSPLCLAPIPGTLLGDSAQDSAYSENGDKKSTHKLKSPLS